MYLLGFLRLALFFLVAQLGTVQAEGSVFLAPSDEEAKLRAVQHERRIESLAPDDEGLMSMVPDDKDTSPITTERRRRWYRRWWRKIKSWYNRYRAHWISRFSVSRTKGGARITYTHHFG